MSNAIITTGRKNQSKSTALAREFSSKLNIPFVERQNISIPKLAELHEVQYVLVAKKNSLRLVTANDEIFFHPSLAHLRIKNILNGEGDRMIEAMNLQRGMKVLDCTLGLGADAIVESFIVGEEGSVTAIEVNPYLAAVVKHGFQNFTDDNTHVINAMRRIKVINADYIDFLRGAEDKSFDVIYFDPMFRHSLERSSSLNPIREVADHRALSIEAIEEAKRVAKYKIVLKENAKSLEFERLGFDKICGGRYSPIHYGVINIE
ncbi:MAG: class I SAM-dependent methyltransferase [Selenomonadaceae bacterium]|nr:class I SAM-dependent methyltransferase [Selenomonadaceae bacterium]